MCERRRRDAIAIIPRALGQLFPSHDRSTWSSDANDGRGARASDARGDGDVRARADDGAIVRGVDERDVRARRTRGRVERETTQRERRVEFGVRGSASARDDERDAGEVAIGFFRNPGVRERGVGEGFGRR